MGSLQKQLISVKIGAKVVSHGRYVKAEQYIKDGKNAIKWTRLGEADFS